MTEKLYYKDVYSREFDAKVLDIRTGEKGEKYVCLDRTAFYPEGGGQPCDRGVLASAEGSQIRVTDVQEKDGIIWHRVDKEISINETVHGIINWERRFDHMQQHSGEHIVSGMLCERFNCDNVGFHMSETFITIDYNAAISFDEALEIEERANRYIWENHPFKEIWPSKEELDTISYRSKKELTGKVRITSFEGADTCACCGTHVLSSAQVGLVKIISAKKFHNGTRIELYCGKRAFDYLASNYEQNKAAAVLLSTSEEKTAAVVRKISDENTSLKKTLSHFENAYYDLRAASFAGESEVFLFEDELNPIQGRALADRISDKCSGLVIVFVKDGDRYRYSAICKDKDISGFIKEMNSALEGRGGGRSGFAQGSLSAPRSQIEKYLSNLKGIKQ